MVRHMHLGRDDPQYVAARRELTRTQYQVQQFLHRHPERKGEVARLYVEPSLAMLDTDRPTRKELFMAMRRADVPRDIVQTVATLMAERLRSPVRLASAPPRSAPAGVGGPCAYCGAPAEAYDHVWPRARGGTDHAFNLVRVCRQCNNRKGSKSLLADICTGCRTARHPSDVDCSNGTAFYACRCGSTWQRKWDLQHPPHWKEVQKAA